MADWKKLVVSGSTAELSGLTITNAVTASTFVGDGSNLTGISSGIFSETGSIQSTTNDLQVSGSLTVSGAINDPTRTITTFADLFDSVTMVGGVNVVGGDVMTSDDGETIIFDSGEQGKFPLSGSALFAEEATIDGTVTATTFIGDGSQLTGVTSEVPSGTVSSSTQIEALGFVTSSGDTLPDGVVSSSTQVDYTQIQNVSADIFSGSFNDISNNPFESGSSSVTASADFVPSITETFDLGSPTRRWRDVYLSGSSIFLDDTKLSRDTDGNLEVRDSNTNNLKKLRVDELEIGQGASARKIKVNDGRISFVDTSDSVLGGDSIGIDGSVSSSAQIDITQTTNYNNVVHTSGNQTIGGNKTFSNNVIVDGDLTINGTTTTIDTQTLNIGDNTIELNFGGSATEAGIIAKDVTAPNTISGSLLWDATNDYWKAGQLGSEAKLLLSEGDGVVSSSAQIFEGSGVISGSVVSDYSELQNIPTGIVSSSVQVDYTQLTNTPSNIVSSSTQVDYTQLTNIPSGILSSSVVDIDVLGNMTVNTLTETSARRYKKNIVELSETNIIDRLKPVEFEWRRDGTKDYGFIAEDVDEIDPLLTTKNDHGGLEGLKYTKLIPLLIKKVQDQDREIDELKNIIKNGNS